METLILAEEHRNQYYYGKRPSHSKTFRQISCRTFHSRVGLIPRPPKKTSSTPVTKGAQSPRSPLPSVDCVRTSPIPIANSKGSQVGDERRNLSYSELWAGPTYSNSPPPTSVPIPKFSLRQKRTVSLTFPAPDLDVDLPEAAKSAPVSPTSSSDNNPFHCTVSATMTLRRMLNLEKTDE